MRSMPHPRMVWFELSWLAAVGMITFLIAAAFGSPVIMLAGAMTWGGFALAARHARRLVASPPVRGAGAAAGPSLAVGQARGTSAADRAAVFRSNTGS